MTLKDYLNIFLKMALFVNGTKSTTNETDLFQRFEEASFRPQSCLGLCGRFLLLPCSCDEYCSVFNRCCYDYDAVCEAEAALSRKKHQQLQNLQKTCIPTATSKMVEVISSCPPDTEIRLLQGCEERKNSTVMPVVTWTKNKLNFKNVFCMMCNGGQTSETEFWGSKVGTFNRKQFPKVSADEVQKFSLNNMALVPAENADNVLCHTRVINTCSENSSLYNEERRLCKESSVSLVTNDVDTETIFKNIHCLKCNNPKVLNYRNTQISDFDVALRIPPFSFTLSWKDSSTFVAAFSKPLSSMKEVQCSLDDVGGVKECTVSKCVGTIEVVDNKCMLTSDHIGCIKHAFRINMTITDDRYPLSIDTVADKIGFNLEQITKNFEARYNITNYIRSNFSVSDVVISDRWVKAFIHLDKLVYRLCGDTNYRHFSYYEDFLEYINQSHVKSSLDFNGDLYFCNLYFACYFDCLPNTHSCSQLRHVTVSNDAMSCNGVFILSFPGIIWFEIFFYPD